MVIETVGTVGSLTVLATGQAIAAVAVVAAITNPQAGFAKRLAARTAVGVTFIAQRNSTTAAAVEFLLVGQVTTVIAALALPILNRHVRALAVVCPQDARHEHKEIEQATLDQGQANGRTALAFAEYFVDHVGMGDRVARVGRMGFLGNHAVRGLGRESAPIESNLKWSQVQPCQFDGLGAHGEPSFVTVEFQAIEMLFQGQEVLMDVAKSDGLRDRPIQLLGQDGQLALQTSHRVTQIQAELRSRQLPAVLLGPPNLAGELLRSLPSGTRYTSER